MKDVMAPKKSSAPGKKEPTGSGTKKHKTSGSARGSRSYDALRFLGLDQQARFAELQSRTIWPGGGFSLAHKDALNQFLGEPSNLDSDQLWEERRAVKTTLTIPAQIIHLLISYNLKPRSHVHTATMNRATYSSLVHFNWARG
ncbi:hypothetical protein TSUD_219630 [Trifolium subterraneum]|uniref:Uncharacterized protein n=1 Tax=Trifolium subterraneum TaxID=3900 RepID=A0A2Z6NVD2_TRISU|nr:hypothetical protein TSUD_219630 [Trifolium subterraneum]